MDLKEFLAAAGVTPCNNCINLTYDYKGYYYEIPNYCINDPYNFEIEERPIAKQPNQSLLKVKIRKVIDEKIYSISNLEIVENLKIAVATNFFENPIEYNKVRLFFAGKELVDKEPIWKYNIEDESIILLLIRENWRLINVL